MLLTDSVWEHNNCNEEYILYYNRQYFTLINKISYLVSSWARETHEQPYLFWYPSPTFSRLDLSLHQTMTLLYLLITTTTYHGYCYSSYYSVRKLQQWAFTGGTSCCRWFSSSKFCFRGEYLFLLFCNKWYAHILLTIPNSKYIYSSWEHSTDINSVHLLNLLNSVNMPSLLELPMA